MITRVQALTQVAPTPFFTPVPREILQRKCACGNHTMAGGKCAECAKNKSGLQRKFAIGASNDLLEQEADRVADHVMATSAHSALRGASRRIQRFTGQATEATDKAPVSVDRVIGGSGRPLDPTLQQDMEQRFGYDFSRVRVHSGSAAEQSARKIDAHAYTVGHNIVFGAGRFAPGTNDGKRLLAHELTHVVQQSSGAQLIQRFVESTEANSRTAEGLKDVGSVLLPIGGIIRGIRSGICLNGLEQPMIDITFNRWIADVCTRTAGGILHSREWDAFGHCWIGCEGSRRCGRGPTAVAGTVREFYREAQRMLGTRPHDSFSQDMANQSNGRELSFTPGTCYALCDNANRTGRLDLSAPQATCIDCASIGSGEVPCPP